MLKTQSLYKKLILFFVSACIVTGVYSRETGFKAKLLEYIRLGVAKEESDLLKRNQTALYSNSSYNPFSAKTATDYQKGDWQRYVISPAYSGLYGKKYPGAVYESENVNILSYGSMKLKLKYGNSVFTSNKYKQYDEDTPFSKVIDSGFLPEQEMQLHMEGRVGERITLYIDHDSRKKDNHYLMNYKALREDEVIREINAGEIDIKFNNSKYAIYDNTSAKGLGIDATLRKGNLQVKAFGSIIKGTTEVEVFRGNSSSGSIILSEYQYTKRTYYQLEPFRRYDNIADTGSLPSGAGAYNTLVTFTSLPSNPDLYSLSPVNIDPDGFELYMDDQDPYNNYNSVQMPVDNGNYTRLSSGIDYTINYITGRITFLKNVSEKARIFAVYRLKSGSTSDPGVIEPADSKHPGGIFSGKLIVFIKYGFSINEDADKDLVLDLDEDSVIDDDRLNLDIYEVRSCYYTGERNLLSDNFRIRFFEENRTMDESESAKTGRYMLEYSNGVIEFIYREPFKTLNPDVYLENQPSNIYVSSRYRMAVDYYREARSFQLKHFNIIPGSLRVKVDGRVLPGSLYSVDTLSGYLIFSNPGNPVIGPETEIEIRYEYIPPGAQSQSFTGGIRTDYRVNRNLKLGGSLLFTRSSAGEHVPMQGDTPEETMLIEGDATLHLGGKKIAQFINVFTEKKRETLPVEINAYGEYARSFRKINTFGKALIDNMEGGDEIINISMSEKDWILSSMPLNSTGLRIDSAERGMLKYFYYRDPSSPGTLKGLSFNAPEIDYSKKPGPYNIAAGHVLNSILEESSQRSLVFNFEFAGAETAIPVVTRKLSGNAVDFSGLQYVEISFKYEGNAGDVVNLSLDVGRVNEDSDNDGVFDTEDGNSNGHLDSDPGSGYSEDTGYALNGNRQTVTGSGPGLNSITAGNGILNTEDLNGNGTLDAAENVFLVPGPQTITAPDSLLGTPAIDGPDPVLGTGVRLTVDNALWQTKRIYMKQGIGQSEIDILKQVESIKLYLQKNNAASGKIYIDGIRFVSSRWGAVETVGADQLKVSLLNTINNNEYKNESFLFSQKQLYKSLYGEMDDSDLLKESETALQLEYSIASAGGSVSVTRRFQKPMDLRYYKTMNLWLNSRNFNPGDKISLRVGSSEYDYRIYDVPLEDATIWREKRIKLNPGSGGDIEVFSVSGTPDMKRISFIQIIINAASAITDGRIWVNDIYLSEPERLDSSAHWYEGELKIKKPVFRTDSGMPVFSDINIKFIQKGHGADFSTVGSSNNDTSEEYSQLFSSMNIFPGWKTDFDFIRESSSTDSLNEQVNVEKRGDSTRNTVNFVSDYSSNLYAVPSIRVSYKYDNYSNSLSENMTGISSPVKSTTGKVTHSPVISVFEKIDDVLWGRFLVKIFINMLFREEDVNSSSSDSAFTSIRQSEKRQKTGTIFSLDYRNSYLYFNPEIEVSSEEIVGLSGKNEPDSTGVISDVNGDFHFPFFYGNNMKFVERKKRASFTFGANIMDFIKPDYRIEIYYNEYDFSDFYAGDIQHEDFSRSKDSRSFISTLINIPLQFSGENRFFLRSLNFSFARSLYLAETSVPYEGEGVDAFKEKYGINRTISGLSDSALNIFSKFPGYFFSGGHNFSNGRDYIYGNFNDGLVYPDGTGAADYNNQLKLISNFSMSCIFDFKSFVVNTSSSINQVSERQNIYGIPQQVISWKNKINFNFDLMKIFNFWFFRPNDSNSPYHSANLNLGYDVENNMRITSNIEEFQHSPGIGITFKWGRSSLVINTGVDLRFRNDREYIPFEDGKHRPADDVYVSNIPQYASFKENDYGYNFSVLYETDVRWIYNVFSDIYRLVAFPVFSTEYTMKINRYDYTRTVSPEPYDLYFLTGKLTMDLHKNVQGDLLCRCSLENFRNRENNGISRQVLSYEIGVNFSLIF